jgi:hypothetical protein
MNHDPAVICYEITRVLTERNLLEIVFVHGIHPPDIDGGMGRPVVLEIEAPSK